ncbi:VWA domain-containing protein [Embleya sp. NPDC008237]|uniref:vWA domain-containing protein n=1 Tax=Embleya sp. NPDC008237 TaxID=3363978 RepID=UPI0036E6A3E3
MFVRWLRLRLVAQVFVILALAAGAWGGGAVAGAAEEDAGRLLVALDVSGSMNEPEGSRAGLTKIAAARAAVDEVVGAVPPGARMGLRTYGGGCTSSALLVPVGPVDKAAFGRAAAGVKADGDTPIAYALRQAAGDLPGPGPRTILLVSDGRETCGGDPVAVARELAAADVRVRIDVIGFRVDDAGRRQLTDVARAGRGQFHDTLDGAELANRLRRAAERALRPYRPAGTPVTGTPTAPSAPVLRPGEYLDVMPPDTADTHPRRYYGIDVPRSATAHVSATVPWNAPPGKPAGNAVRVALTTVDGRVCAEREQVRGKDRDHTLNGGYVTAHATVELEPDPAAAPGACGGGGRFLVRVDNREPGYRDTQAPLEMSIVIEPEITDPKALPPAWTATDVPTVHARATARPTTGAGSYGDAPPITDGVHTDALRPGEEVYYRVHLTWGERLTYRLDLSELPASERRAVGGTAKIRTGPVNPVRDWAALPGGNTDWRDYDGSALTIVSATAPVRHNNLDSAEYAIASASLPGDYFIWLQMDVANTDPQLRVPFTLTVNIDGVPNGAPRYRDPTNLGSPESQLSAPAGVSTPGTPPSSAPPPAAAHSSAGDSGRSSTLRWATVAAASIAVATAATWLTLRRGRRRS